jgi:hypothetical protein
MDMNRFMTGAHGNNLAGCPEGNEATKPPDDGQSLLAQQHPSGQCGPSSQHHDVD